MKKIVLLRVFGLAMMLTALFAGASCKKNKPVIAIATFDTKEANIDNVELLMDIFTSNFADLKVAKIVDHKHFDKIMKERPFQFLDWSDKNKMAELRRSLKADHIVVGQLIEQDSNLFFTAQILDLKTATVVSSHVDKMRNIDDFFEKMPEFCNHLVMNTNDKNLFSRSTVIQADNVGNHKNKVEYNIGDIGSGGGIIFHIDGNTAWEVSEKLGERNWEDAMLLCKEYRGGGYADWYLPNKKELDWVYESLAEIRKIEIQGQSRYWSSSSLSEDFDDPIAEDYAWSKFFTDGRWEDDDDKGCIRSVLAIRTFNTLER